MKITGRCRDCGRDFPADMLLQETAGHCPFCGSPADPHYAAPFVKALAEAQRSGAAFVNALEHLASLGPNFELNDDSILDPIRAVLKSRESRAAKV